MATVSRANNASFLAQSRRSYLTTGTFNDAFFSYSTHTYDTQHLTVGTLAPLAGATSANCPRGRVLRENGKKLFPVANPGVSTFMVGVYDEETFLKGYIDPNSPLFAGFNTDKPNFITVATDPATGLSDLGAPVYTRGTIESLSTITSGAGITSTDGEIVAASGQIRASNLKTYGTSSGASVNVDITEGQLFEITASTIHNFGINATNTTGRVGAMVYLKIINDSLGAIEVTLGGNIRELITSPNPRLIMGAGTTYMMTFICDGANLLELARTGPLQPG